MLASLSRNRPNLSLNDIRRGLLLGTVGLAFIFVMANLALSWAWINRPFAGFLMRNRAVTETDLPGWPARPTRLSVGDVILSVDGRTLSPEEWPAYVRRQVIGQPLTYSVQNRAGETAQITVPVALFTARDFIKLAATPILIAFIALITAGVVLYFRADLLPARLFSLFMLVLVLFIASLPDLVSPARFPFNFVAAAAGGILMPPLLLHFLFLFPYRREILQRGPFLLPLIYLPVLPAFMYLPTLVDQPQAIHNFDRAIGLYTAIYSLGGLILLGQAAIGADHPLQRKQALVFWGGLIFPAALYLLDLLPVDSPGQIARYRTIEQYAFVGVPFAAAVGIVRYDLFGIDKTSRWHVSYLETIAILVFGYFLLVLVINPVMVDFSWIHPGDLGLVVYTVAGFFVLRPLYKSGRRWFEHRFRGSVEEFRASLRIFSHELLKVKSRRDLEALVSWDIPGSFKIKSAELAARHRPSSPYALQLPLRVSNVSLGALYFGAKIDGKGFTGPEQAIFAELQKQVSLALWSIELDEAIQAIEELTRLKSKFLANVTHELRTPLNGIINYIGFVLDGDVGGLNASQTGHLRRALQAAERLLDVINNILDMSKIEAGQMTLHLRPLHLADLVTEMLPVVEEMLDNKPVTIVKEVSPDLPLLQGDRLRLRQIILNLCSNAARFTAAGTIRLKLFAENGRVVIQVADTGQGIDQADLPLIFQQFTSTSLTDINQFSGPGLGMPITKSLVELHGGQIEVTSQSGSGTTFTVSLPLNHQLTMSNE